MGRTSARSTVVVRTAVVLLALALTAVSQAQEPQHLAAASGPSDPAEVEAFFDDLIKTQMQELHIAGAAVAVVRDGEPLLLKGYGHADIDNGVEVDPQTTLFRIASITKSFTAIAVLQLVEQGRLDLDADINTYLDFRIPATFEQPITLRHLLTHTAGFEDLFYEILVLDESDMTPFGQWMASHLPARVRPPGVAAAYSNYGLSLAGYIVERTAGQPFAAYLREHVLGPLGMDHTTTTSIWTAELAAAETKGYVYENGRFVVTPYYLGQPGQAPAGGLLSTASDMARFMIMHLEDGRFVTADGAEGLVLGPESVRLMHTTQHAADPRLLGTTFGLFDFSDNGQRTLGHSGEAYPTNSLMLLLPDLDVGFFVVYNSEGAADLVNQHLGFQREVFDHYFPTQVASAPAGSATNGTGAAADWAPVDTTRFAGQYRLTRGSYTTFEKVGVLFGAVSLTSTGSGTLALTTPWGVFDFGAVDPLYLRQVDGPFSLSFAEDERGRVRYMFTDLTPMFAFERLRWFETPTFNMALLAVCLVLLLSVLAAAVVRAVTGRRALKAPRTTTGTASERSAGEHTTPTTARWAHRALAAVAIAALLFVVGVVVFGNTTPLFGVSLGLNAVLALGVVIAVLTGTSLAAAFLAWKEGYWRLPTRLHYSLGTLAAVGFVWFMNNWNLLGWRY